MLIEFGLKPLISMPKDKLQIRPAILSIKAMGNTSVEEQFQNTVLRPIIKLQNDLIITYFEHYLKIKKTKIRELNDTQTHYLLQNVFNRDTSLKADLRGLIILFCILYLLL